MYHILNSSETEMAEMQSAIRNDLKNLGQKHEVDITDFYYLTLQPLNLYFKNNPPKKLQKDIVTVLDKYFKRY